MYIESLILPLHPAPVHNQSKVHQTLHQLKDNPRETIMADEAANIGRDGDASTLCKKWR